MKARASVSPSLAAPCSVWEGRLASNPSSARAAAFGLNCRHRRREQENAASENPGKDESKPPGDDGWVPDGTKKSKHWRHGGKMYYGELPAGSRGGGGIF